MSAPTLSPALSARDCAVLAAAGAGRCVLVSGCEPDLLVDGRWCCDQPGARALVAAGLLAPTEAAAPGRRVAVALTGAGREALAAA